MCSLEHWHLVTPPVLAKTAFLWATQSSMISYPVSLSQVVQRFQELFSQTKYKEAAELAAESPQGLLRTPETVAKFQVLICCYYFLMPAFIISLIVIWPAFVALFYNVFWFLCILTIDV